MNKAQDKTFILAMKGAKKNNEILFNILNKRNRNDN